MRTPAFVALVALLLACDAPPVSPAADRANETPPGTLRGSLIYAGPARGDVLVFAYDAKSPPPPKGRGRPKNFALVKSAALFHGASSAAPGPFTADFALTQLAPGDYLVTALLDRDGCVSAGRCRASDFIPWFSVTNEPNAGDVLGGHVDPATAALLPVTVGANEVVGEVNVVLADAQTLPLDRPAFAIKDASDTDGVPLAGVPLLLTLESAPLLSGAVDERDAAFLVRFVDDDGDGVADDANADGVPDVWPKVFVRKLDDNPARLWLVDENDLDKNGLPDDTGVSYPHLDPSLDGSPSVVVLAAGVNPSEYLPRLLDANGKPDVTKAVPASHLTVVVRPLALDASPSASSLSRGPAPLASVPAGRYAVIVQQATGQTWRVPNEASPSSGAAQAFGLPSLAGQGAFVAVP